MLTLIGVALFCLLTALGTTDKSLLAPEVTVKIPFADAPLSFLGFMIVAPLLLVVLTIYLHIFFGYWLDLERERQQINQDLASTHEVPVESVATLFSLSDPVSRLLTTFIFYLLVPVVLTAVTWKAAGRPDMYLSRILIYVTGLVICGLLFLRIRRCPDSQRRWRNPPRWAMLCVVVALLLLATVRPQAFHRPLNLFRVDLKEAWLPQVDLSGAMMEYANLQKAVLERANLQGAYLRAANLQEADLFLANLQDANLIQANLIEAYLRPANLRGAVLDRASLQRADLQGADLQGADLQNANLRGANLQGANLQGVDLKVVSGLTEEQLARARTDKSAVFPGFPEGGLDLLKP